ncbi:hypothetical protein GCM10026987_25600 [Belliella aquatica]|uniref:Uncharacterized protein n=1 Tax=Belliella aquatica TaxID=1323734 RepID=A0ABQ1N6A9_9BACT|nr:hypothetical protein GCM10010993_30290 [Belliella aquatica]
MTKMIKIPINRKGSLILKNRSKIEFILSGVTIGTYEIKGYSFNSLNLYQLLLIWKVKDNKNIQS